MAFTIDALLGNIKPEQEIAERNLRELDASTQLRQELANKHEEDKGMFI